MSGPKVVRIVTRAELIEICRGQIARLEDAISYCERVALRNGVLSDAQKARWQSGLARVEHLLQQDRFAEVQKQVPQLIDAMRHELSQKLEAMHSAEAAARRRHASLRSSVRQLQAHLQAAHVDLPLELERQLQAGAAGNLSADQLQQVVANGLRLLPLAGKQELTPSQQETVRALSGDGKIRMFADWLKESQKDHPQVTQLDRYLGQLAACEAMESFHELSERIDAACQEIDERRRQILFDSLCLEAAARVRLEQRYAAIRQASADEKAVIRSSGDEGACREGMVRLEQALALRQYDAAEAELQKLQGLRVAAAKARATQAGRIALLQGLREMGYTVNEGMATIWSQRQTLVVRHPQQRGIAVELGAVGQNNQFQARVVSLQNEQRDSTTDLQAETEWCNSLAKIQNKIAECGGELKIERATPAGRNPLKTVRLDSEASNSSDYAQLRSLENKR